MATAQPLPPHWTDYRVAVINGLGDTRKKSQRPYGVRPLADVFRAQVCRLPKESAPAFLPSLYAEPDARAHDAQKAQGRFVALIGDVDHGNHPLAQIEELTSTFANGSAWKIYSTASARADDRRWRIVLPLTAEVPFARWYDAQLAFAAYMRAAGVDLDTSAARPGQVSFLPNVPAEMRGDDDAPLFFEESASSIELNGLDLDRGPVAAEIVVIERQRARDDAERERIRREAEQRRKARPASEHDASVIDTFNRSNSVEDLLSLYEYVQSPRDRRDWRSRYQGSGTYATRVLDGGKWVSLSGSDVANGVGAQCSSGCFGDAYDLFVHYDHGGDTKAAWRAACQEQGRDRPKPANDPGYSYGYDPETGEVPDDEPAGTQGQQGEDEPDKLPMQTLDLAFLAGVPPQPKLFAIERIAPLEDVTLLTGPGSAGKSLLGQQVATCSAAGIKCLGLDVMAGPAIYMTCEDDEQQLHFRQDAICRALGIKMDALAGQLHLISLKGKEGNELCLFDSDGKIKPTSAFRRLLAMVKMTGAKLVILDNVAHLFTGNENDRGEVTRFANLLGGLAQATGASVILLGHPNKGGDTYSGSTAWLNAVRSQVFMAHDENTDVRTLTLGKANYARKGEAVRFAWQDWCFVLESDLSPDRRAEMAELSKAAHEDERFLACLRARASQGIDRAAGPSPGPNYAPAQFEGMMEAQGLNKAAMKRAMDRLYAGVRIRTETVTRPGKSETKSILVEVTG